MSASARVTEAQARSVLALVEQRFASYIPSSGLAGVIVGPRLVREEAAAGPDWCILWLDDAPDEWAMKVSGGGLDADLMEAMTAAEVPHDAAVSRSTVQPVPLPPGVHCEAITAHVLGLYPS